MITEKSRGLPIRYVTHTRFGDFVLPAEHISDEIHGEFYGISVFRVYIDNCGGTEWVVTAPYSKEKLPNTWHMVGD